MITDKKLYYSEDQAETTQAAHDSTNVIDMGTNTNAFGTTKENNYGINAKESNCLNILVTTAFTTSAGGTLAIKLQDSLDNAVSDAYADTEISLPATAVADLEEGDYFVYKLPNSLKRWTKCLLTIGTGAMTAGAVSIWIGDNYESRVSNSLTA